MKFILMLLIILIILYVGKSFKILKITPLTIPTTFQKKKDIHETIIDLYLNKDEINANFMLFISDYNLKYDDELLEDAWKYCKYKNVITTDLRTLDRRQYSCCTKKEKMSVVNQTWKYACPIPSFPERDFLFNLFFDNKFPIYIKQFWENSTLIFPSWEYTGYTMNYLQKGKIYTFFHHFVIWSTFIWMIGCITYTIMSYINKWSNQHEILFTILHIVSTIIVIYFEAVVYINSSDYCFSKDIFLFSLMNTFYSIFLIYIPHHKNPEDPHSIEQRVPIEDAVFEFSLKIFKHPITKQICSIFYISSFVFEIILETEFKRLI